jgi:hypothetical protein
MWRVSGSYLYAGECFAYLVISYLWPYRETIRSTDCRAFAGSTAPADISCIAFVYHEYDMEASILRHEVTLEPSHYG